MQSGRAQPLWIADQKKIRNENLRENDRLLDICIPRAANGSTGKMRRSANPLSLKLVRQTNQPYNMWNPKMLMWFRLTVAILSSTVLALTGRAAEGPFLHAPSV